MIVTGISMSVHAVVDFRVNVYCQKESFVWRLINVVTETSKLINHRLVSNA